MIERSRGPFLRLVLATHLQEHKNIASQENPTYISLLKSNTNGNIKRKGKNLRTTQKESKIIKNIREIEAMLKMPTCKGLEKGDEKLKE